MINICIGYDRKESVAYHVLCHSLIRRSSQPLNIIPLARDNLKAQWTRPRGEYDSTDFSNTRWIIPHLMNFNGWCVFMDCDMLCLGDIAELWEQRDDRYAVMVKKHYHVPKEQKKFLDQDQHIYGRKNWSSLMLMNCDKLRMLTKHITNTHNSGLWFHQFQFLPDDEIGNIEGAWNLLVDYDEHDDDAKLVHFTSGGPWHGFHDADYALEWEEEYEDMMHGDNPVLWHG